MIRAFLAVDLSEELRLLLAQVQNDLRQQLSHNLSKAVRISWVHPGSIHFTIKFLGDMDESVIEPLRTVITEAMAGHRPIQIPLERIGVFPRLQQPRVLWIGALAAWDQGADAKRLAELHLAIETGCHVSGFVPEGRPLSPHLTLARIKEGEREFGQALARSGLLDRPRGIGTLPIVSIVLMKSDLRPTGPVYTKLWEVN